MLRLDRRFVRCALVWATVFGLLLLPWPGLGLRFNRAFCAVADFFTQAVHLHQVLRLEFQPAAETGTDASDWSAALVIRNAATGGGAATSAMHLRPIVYAPLCVYIATALGVPGRTKRIWLRSALLGLVVTLVLLALFTGITTAWFLTQVFVVGSDDDSLALLAGQRAHLVELGRSGQWALGMLYGFVQSLGCEVVFVGWAASLWAATSGPGWLRSRLATARAASGNADMGAVAQRGWISKLIGWPTFRRLPRTPPL
jgi:hypothetical protein